MKKKIAIITQDLSFCGGAENLVIWMTEELIAQGHSVKIFTTNATAEQIKHLPIEIVYIGLRTLKWRSSINFLTKALKEYDIINSHNFPANLFCSWVKNRLSKKAFGVPKFVWFCHEPKEDFYGKSIEQCKILFKTRWRKHKLKYFQQNVNIRLDRKSVCNHDYVFCNSKRTRDFVEHVYGRSDAEVLYPALPVSHFNKRSEFNSKDKYILIVSRLFPVKNIDTAIKSFASVIKTTSIELKLQIAGSGPSKNDLIELSKELGVSDRISFLGFVSDDEIQRLYRDAFAVLNIPKEEPFGLSTLEAMSKSVPVIISRDAGSSEIIIDHVDGLKVCSDKVEEISESIKLLSENEKKYYSISMNAYDKAKKLFSIDLFVSKMINV